MKFSSLSSLAARLIISHLLVGLISIGVIASIAAQFILENGRREVEIVYDEIAFLLSNNLEMPFISLANGQRLDTSELKNIMETGLADRRNVNYAIFLADGTLVVSNEPSTDFKDTPPEVATALTQGDSIQTRPNAQGIDSFYIAVPITHESVIYGVLRLSGTFPDNMGPTYRSIYLLILIAVLLLIGVGLSSWWFSHSLTRPIHHLTAVANRLSSGQLESRAVAEGPNELQQFANTFNQMASQLQTNMEGLRAFVANASHELRTPMTAIKLHVDALADGAIADPEVAERFLGQLQKEIDRMSNTVNDLLDLSRIEANRGKVSMEEVDLREILLETRDFWRARSLQANVELSLHLPETAPQVIGNEDQLRRVFHNLVDNAIKHTPSGGSVDISLHILPQRGVLRVEVRDNGYGIPAEHLPRIFERFYRAELAQERNISGSGLGLAIAKSIIEAHNGLIGVSSMEGVGSTFWIELNSLLANSYDRKTIPVTSTKK